MSKNCQLIGITTVMHFLMDGLCMCCLFLLAMAYGDYWGAYGDRLILGAILTYNVLAFMSQPLTGLMADRMTQRHWLLLSSIASAQQMWFLGTTRTWTGAMGLISRKA